MRYGYEALCDDENIHIDVDAESASEAQEKAITEAQRLCCQELYDPDNGSTDPIWRA